MCPVSDIREAFHKLILDQTIVHGKLMAMRVPDYDDLMRDINRLFAELKNMLMRAKRWGSNTRRR